MWVWVVKWEVGGAVGCGLWEAAHEVWDVGLGGGMWEPALFWHD